MTQTQTCHRQTLYQLFEKRERAAERIGVEVEVGVLDPESGVSAPYEGPAGLQALLKAVERTGGWEAKYEGQNLMALERADGSGIKLEHGGAVEYSSPPVSDLTLLAEVVRRELSACAEVAAGLGLALVPGGNLPFNTAENTRWVPKARGRIMRDYFASLGAPGAGGPRVMSEALSTQVTLDYTSEGDMGRKMRTLVAVAPIATALFANSPLEGGWLCGALSRRAQHYFTCDPRRCGFIPPALGRIMRFEEFVGWAAALPMIFRAKGDGYAPAHGRDFATLLREGFDDGTKPTPAHWRSHLSQIYTDVRLRDTIEIRAVDGVPLDYVPAVAAFWVGLVYHRPSLDAAWELMEGQSEREHHAALREVPSRGLAARHGGEPVLEIARALVRLAGEGLRARVEAGLERPSVVKYLELVNEIVASGVTLAERCARRWETELRRSAPLYVRAYRI